MCRRNFSGILGTEFDPKGIKGERLLQMSGLPLSYDVRHLQRYALGTGYPAIVEDVSQKVGQLNEVVLTIDHTGCGRPVFDLFERAGLRPLGITITGGDTGSRRG